jgi:hypothetical protein
MFLQIFFKSMLSSQADDEKSSDDAANEFE